MSCVAVIPARGGSRRIPGKNAKYFHGKPIIAYSIETALKSRLFDAVYVSTDDQRIAQASEAYGAAILNRTPEMAKDAVGTQTVMRDCAVRLGYPDILCCIYATAPMMTEKDLKCGRDQMDIPGVGHVISIGYPPLRDAAQFYWSWGDALGIEYFGQSTRLVKVDANRICDINTQEDWQLAEQMYGRIHGKE